MYFTNSTTRLASFLQTLYYLSGFQLLSHQPSLEIHSTQAAAVSLAAHSPEIQVNAFYKAAAADSATNATSRCFGILGCVEIHNELQIYPKDISHINPLICLKTVKHSQCQYISLHQDPAAEINRLELAASATGGSDSYWLAHGYFENGQRKWLHTMAAELLTVNPNANVFIVDWGNGVEPPYNQAAVNTRLAGFYIGFVMAMLQNSRQLHTTQVHSIGHSLGAHLFGFAGKWLHARGYNMGRITGLDPAQPYFEAPAATESARLTSKDALFVDIIHTDASPLMHEGVGTGLGYQQPAGHVDFYPNAGKSQPGCTYSHWKHALQQENNSITFGVLRYFGCNHIRAIEYFIESINRTNGQEIQQKQSSCAFMAFKCESFQELTEGNCQAMQNCSVNNGNCNQMGFYAHKPNSTNYNESLVYYGFTGNSEPYCREEYLVSFLSSSEEEDFNCTSDSFPELSLTFIAKSGIPIDKLRLNGRILLAPDTKLNSAFKLKVDRVLNWLSLIFSNRNDINANECSKLETLNAIEITHLNFIQKKLKFCKENNSQNLFVLC